MNPNSGFILGSDLCVLPHSYSRKVNQTAAVLTAAPHVTAREQETFLMESPSI